MRRFTFLSTLLSLEAFATGMTNALPEVVSNATTHSREGIDMDTCEEPFVRPDGTDAEPRDYICSIYSQLGKLDNSYISNPPYIIDLPESERFERTMNDVEDKCARDFPTYKEDCLAALDVLDFMEIRFTSLDVAIADLRLFVGPEKTLEEALTKPEMCGEGWKHGQAYVKARESKNEETMA